MGLMNGDARVELASGTQSLILLPFPSFSRGARIPSFMEWGRGGMCPETILSLLHLKESAECISSKIVNG